MKDKVRVKGLRRSLLLWCSFFSFFLSVNLFGQTIDITGLVQDEKGEAIIGANVLIKGTARGTITDYEGRFVLSIPSDGTLVVSYLGYNTQEIQVQEKTIKITLKEDVELLEEIVIIGYGTVKKRRLNRLNSNFVS